MFWHALEFHHIPLERGAVYSVSRTRQEVLQDARENI